MKLGRKGVVQAASIVALSFALTGLAPGGGASAQDAASDTATPTDAAPAPAAEATEPSGISESVAAVVNDAIISTYDLGQRMRLLIATTGIQPTEQNLPQIQRQALISLVDERLQLQELRRVEKEQKFDIVASDKEVTEEIADMAKSNNMTAEQLMTSLKARGVGAETLRSQIRTQISWQRWIRGRYGSRLKIGDDQVKAAQRRLAEEASKPQYEISEVYIDASRVGGMESAAKGAAQLVTQLQQGAPFAAVARQFSASSTAANGGDAGWVTPTELPPQVQQVVSQMRAGQLSQPIAVDGGIYIIYLRDKRTGAAATLVSLKQAAVPLAKDATPAQVAAAQAKLEALRPTVTGCDNLEAAASKIDGVVAGDLGESDVNDLSPDFRKAAETLQPGQLSQPIRTEAGLHLIAVCGRRAGGDNQLTTQQVERRLEGEQLSMIAKRYMRDLRNSATIETR